MDGEWKRLKYTSSRHGPVRFLTDCPPRASFYAVNDGVCRGLHAMPVAAAAMQARADWSTRRQKRLHLPKHPRPRRQRRLHLLKHALPRRQRRLHLLKHALHRVRRQCFSQNGHCIHATGRCARRIADDNRHVCLCIAGSAHRTRERTHCTVSNEHCHRRSRRCLLGKAHCTHERHTTRSLTTTACASGNTASGAARIAFGAACIASGATRIA